MINLSFRRISLTLIFGLMLFVADLQAREPYRIIAYNVENFFDAQHDDQKNDDDFTPYGAYRWTDFRFSAKAEQIARVITQAGQWDTPLVVGLCEVENASCLTRLMHCMPNHPYRFLHSESPDERGIDVALLYDSLRFQILEWSAMPVDLDDDYTRDILYAKGLIPESDTLHIMMCHLPSMRGGEKASEWKRQRAKQVIQTQTDSILAYNPEALVVVMGDMNSQPKDDIKGLINRMISHRHKHKNDYNRGRHNPNNADRQNYYNSQRNSIQGTHKWQGTWSCLDQFYLSPALDRRAETRIFAEDFLLEDDDKHLGKRPIRTFQGYRYNPNGYSDHLPIILDF